MILSEIQLEAFIIFFPYKSSLFRGFKSPLVVNSQVEKPESVALSKV